MGQRAHQSGSISVVVVILSVSAFLPYSARAALPPSLFVNSEFDTGDFTGWTAGGSAAHGVDLGGTALTGTVIPQNIVCYNDVENQAAWAKLENDGTPTDFTLSQTIAVQPGVTYAGQYAHGLGSFTNSGSGVLRFEVFVNGTPLLQTDFFAVNGYQLLNGGAIPGWTAPNNVTQATYVFRWTGGSGGSPAGFSFDNFQLRTAVPEPSSITVIAAATLAAAIRRAPRRRDYVGVSVSE